MPNKRFNDPAKDGAKGGRKKAENLGLEGRSLVAWRAIAKRWYKFTSEDVERVDSYLRLLAGVAGRAMDAGDDDKLMRAVAAMAPYERMKIVLLREGAAKVVTPIENESGEDAARRYEEGRMKAIKDGTVE